MVISVVTDDVQKAAFEFSSLPLQFLIAQWAWLATSSALPSSWPGHVLPHWYLWPAPIFSRAFFDAFPECQVSFCFVVSGWLSLTFLFMDNSLSWAQAASYRGILVLQIFIHFLSTKFFMSLGTVTVSFGGTYILDCLVWLFINYHNACICCIFPPPMPCIS